MLRHRSNGPPRHAARSDPILRGRAALTRAVLIRAGRLGGAKLIGRSEQIGAVAVRLGRAARRQVRAAAAGAGRVADRPQGRSTVRGALYTPWLAVTFGVVVAVLLTLATSHTALRFPAGRGGVCVSRACRIGGRGTGRAPAARRGVKLKLAPPGPVKVSYAVLGQHHDGFLAAIAIRGRKPLGIWTLTFDLPGARIRRILGGRWTADAAGRVVVHAVPLWWGRSRNQGARLVIFGTGTPGSPSDCGFDGASCTFRAMSRPDARWGGPAWRLA